MYHLQIENKLQKIVANFLIENINIITDDVHFYGVLNWRSTLKFGVKARLLLQNAIR